MIPVVVFKFLTLTNVSPCSLVMIPVTASTVVLAEEDEDEDDEIKLLFGAPPAVISLMSLMWATEETSAFCAWLIIWEGKDDWGLFTARGGTE